MTDSPPLRLGAFEVGDPLARGGWTDRPIRLSLRGTGGTRYLPGNPGAFGGEVATRVRMSPVLRTDSFVGMSHGEREEWGGWLTLRTLRLGTGIAGQWHRQRVDLSVGAGVEAVWVRQYIESLEVDDADEPIETSVVDREQLMPGAYGQVGVHLPVGPRAGVELGLRTHLMRALVDDLPQILVEGQAYAGLTVGLGGRSVERAGRR